MTHPPVTRRTVGSWEIHDVIGSGSFAIVWKARHVVTGALSAVKEILADRLNKKLQESLESEIAVLQRLKHTNIVGLLDLYKEPGKIYLVLEYCGGGDLAQHLRQRGPLSEASCRYLLRQLAEGLKVLRQHNVIHRDLKPQNLLLSDNGPSPTLKIADFGFARSLQPAGLAETLCGSPLYMAPEVLQLHRYDAKADLWSVGTILFELLTGKPPFSGANHYQLVQNIERGDAVVPEHIARSLSPGCRQLLHQLLRRNPVERISFDELFAHPFLVGEAASAAVTTPLPGSSSSSSTGGTSTAPPASPPGGFGTSPHPSFSPAPAAWAPHAYGSAPQQLPLQSAGGAARRFTPPASQGAVRFVQPPPRCTSPVHPAFQVPPPPARGGSPAPTQQPQSVQGGGAPDGPPRNGSGGSGGGGAGGAAPGAAGVIAGSLASPAAGGGINVRELTRSPSPRIIAAAAAVASALVVADGRPPAGPGIVSLPSALASAGTSGTEVVATATAGGGGSGPVAGAGAAFDAAPPPVRPAINAPPPNTRGNTGLGGPPAGGAGGAPPAGGGEGGLEDSVDSDYVVVSSPTMMAMAAGGQGAAASVAAAPRGGPTPVPLSPRTPHPAMAPGPRGGSSRSGSAGGAGAPPSPAPPTAPQTAAPPPPPGGPDNRSSAATVPVVGAVGTGRGAPKDAGAPGVPLPSQASWQQLLSPIAHAATLPPASSHGAPYPLSAAAAAALGVMGPHVAGATAAAAAAAPAALSGAPAPLVPGATTTTTLTSRVPGPGAAGGCEEKAGGGAGGSDPCSDPLLLPRVVGVLLDHAQCRCTALLDAEAEARQLGDTLAAAAAGAAVGGGRGGGALQGPSCEAGAAAAINTTTSAQLADEAAAAVGTLLVACRLLLAALSGSAAAADGGPPEGSGGAAEGRGVIGDIPCCPPSPPVHPATRPPVTTGGGRAAGAGASPPLLLLPCGPNTPPGAPLEALAGAARSVMAALDEHLHGTVARILLGATPPDASAPPKAAPPSPAPAPATPPLALCTVPCGLDALLSTAVHHSRAAAGEELLGNTAGAAEHYGRAADVLTFLLATPQQLQQAPGRNIGCDPAQEQLLSGAVRPPLTPHDRHRLTKYYAAVRLRQSAALAAMTGPMGVMTSAAVGTSPPLSYHPHPHHNHYHHVGPPSSSSYSHPRQSLPLVDRPPYPHHHHHHHLPHHRGPLVVEAVSSPVPGAAAAAAGLGLGVVGTAPAVRGVGGAGWADMRL